MLHVSYTNKQGAQYTVHKIEDLNQIDLDIAEVEDKLIDTYLPLYKKNMVTSLEQGLAFAIFKEDKRIGFVYMLVKDNMYIGVSIHLEKDVTGMLIGLRTIFEIYDAHKIKVTPHPGGLKYFLSMATGSSIRAYHTHGSPLTILREDIYEKGKKMFKYLGLTDG